MSQNRGPYENLRACYNFPQIRFPEPKSERDLTGCRMEAEETNETLPYLVFMDENP